MAHFHMESEEIRNIITGKTSFRKCPNCVGRGYEWYCGETGVVFHNQSLPEEDIEEALGEWADRYECENCKGIGYIVIPN